METRIYGSRKIITSIQTALDIHLNSFTREGKIFAKCHLLRDGPLFLWEGGGLSVSLKKLFVSCSWLKTIVCFRVMN